MITDKIVSLQGYFIYEAWKIGRIVLFISLIMAAINFALTGEGLKQNLIKIGKALVFFIVIMQVYPRIVSNITQWTFNRARWSTWDNSVQKNIDENIAATVEHVELSKTAAQNPGASLGSVVSNAVFNAIVPARNGVIAIMSVLKALDDPAEPRDLNTYFDVMLVPHETPDRKFTYWAVAPQAAMGVIMVIAGDCMDYALQKDSGTGPNVLPNFGRILTGLICALMVILTGSFAVLEYLMAFIEFIFITSVGVILFPLSLWEGTKFMAEKLISAIVGFFVKLLFCTICIFLTLWLFTSLMHMTVKNGFVGGIDQMVTIIFVCLFAFYLCKSAPALAQSLLTGSPSLSATGVIGAAAGGIAAGMKAVSMAAGAGGAVASGVTKAAVSGMGMATQAGSAARTVRELGGTGSQAFGAAMSSVIGSAGQTISGAGHNLTRSLLTGEFGHRGGGGGGSPFSPHTGAHDSANPYSNLQRHLNATKEVADPGEIAGKRIVHHDMNDYKQARKRDGEEAGLDYAIQHGIGNGDKA
jgi:hypothetical protein